MGVLGLTPFLQKTCPEVIRKLPDRLRSLCGKTIVIDGTLITQRLHFAPMPHPHRHVLGWHRIITELKECNVKAICVFDGRDRSVAKAREVERRREIRRLDAARSSIEVERLSRLRKLMRLLPQYRSMDPPDRRRVTDALEHVSVAPTTIPTYSQPSLSPSGSIQNDVNSVIVNTARSQTCPSGHSEFEQVFNALSSYPEEDTLSTLYDSVNISDADMKEILLARTGQSVAVITPSDPKSWPDHINSSALDPGASLIEGIPNLRMQDLPLGPGIGKDSVSPPEDVLFALSTLYQEYRDCVAQITSLPSTVEVPESPDETRVENIMSRSQLQMTIEEGQIWDTLADAPETALTTLAEKSGVISESYARRSNPPTVQTYEESKEILRAMGVPCIESEGPFEAEALASSLVIHGIADYVASEDTDVLVYEAPLIRNIANRNDPLILVYGSHVRSALQLSKSAYIDFLLLLGTDFSQRIKNVGPQRALKFIREYGSIERVIAQEHKYPPRLSKQMYLEQVGIARLAFATLPPTPDPEMLKQRDVNHAKVADIVQKYRLQRVLPVQWNHGTALEGNYFADNPRARKLTPSAYTSW
ncbi:PIN domain-like protein [Suillus clintonianus]|uniref:PIN domain-like protein n=1 Tax=Suillus clintonianus TaxID=1904413 RepID=UPI001B86ED5F|nr:PIN domain-like protein [Suillus clintonianus]KAG2134858.1 PIN domain-like protein [Suillus clintonianus]